MSPTQPELLVILKIPVLKSSLNVTIQKYGLYLQILLLIGEIDIFLRNIQFLFYTNKQYMSKHDDS